MKTKNFPVLLILSAMIFLIGFYCSKGGGYSNSGGSGGNGNPNGISMINMTFSPASKTVTKGTVVTWTNNDGYSHTVTSNDSTSFNSGIVTAGSTFSYTANVVGTFNYHCMIHGFAMSGTLIVTQ